MSFLLNANDVPLRHCFKLATDKADAVHYTDISHADVNAALGESGASELLETSNPISPAVVAPPTRSSDPVRRGGVRLRRSCAGRGASGRQLLEAILPGNAAGRPQWPSTNSRSVRGYIFTRGRSA